MRFAPVCLVGLAVVLSGCGKSTGLPSKAGIQAAIERHLQQRPSVVLKNMTLEVQDVKFEGDRAVAEVKFRSKQAAEIVVGVRYELRKAGDHWEVESSSPTGGMGASPHATTPAPGPSALTPQPSH